MNRLEGSLIANGLKIAIVASRFNEFITSRLLGGALDGLRRHGADEDLIDVAWVPGAFEIPLAAHQARQERPLRRGHLSGCGHPRKHLTL